MERNEILTAGELKIGHRFYRLEDKRRIVCEIVDREQQPENTGRNFKLQCVTAAIMDLPTLSHRAKLNQQSNIMSNVKVVFLRDADPQSQEYNRQKLEHYHK